MADCKEQNKNRHSHHLEKRQVIRVAAVNQQIPPPAARNMVRKQQKKSTARRRHLDIGGMRPTTVIEARTAGHNLPFSWTCARC